MIGIDIQLAIALYAIFCLGFLMDMTLQLT
jgi:hypothetical protein